MLESIIALDNSVFSGLASLPHSWLVNSLFWWISLSGYALGVVAIIFYVYQYIKFKKDRGTALWVPVAFILLFICVRIVKLFVERIRPNGELFSFPSGHTTIAFFIAFVLPVDKKWKPLLFVWAGLVGFSRLWLEHHWLSDVIVGVGIGIIAGYITKEKIKKEL